MFLFLSFEGGSDRATAHTLKPKAMQKPRRDGLEVFLSDSRGRPQTGWRPSGERQPEPLLWY